MELTEIELLAPLGPPEPTPIRKLAEAGVDYEMLKLG
jgi:hypothetical protein